MATIKGGEKFKAAMAVLAKKLNAKQTLRVGFLENATYPNGTPVALIAMIQDFGAPSRGIPPRPFFRNMVWKNEGSWPPALSKVLKSTNYDVDKSLRLMGELIAGQLRQSIIETNSPPLSPRTVARKGSSKPLVDTGHMLQSVDYDVK
jgi:hypothetical protein